MDPQDGKTLWSIPWKTNYDVNAATPVYRDGHLFITSAVWPRLRDVHPRRRRRQGRVEG